MTRKVLFVDLENQTFEAKSLDSLDKYIGGVGLGIKLIYDNYQDDIVVIATGPFNGFFPFASKTAVIFENKGVLEDLYFGGTLSTRLRYAGIDAIVLMKKSVSGVILDINNEVVTFRSKDTDIQSFGLPGKKSVLSKVKGKYFLDEYFVTDETFLDDKLLSMGLEGLVITGTKTFDIENKEKYEELYKKILNKHNELLVGMDSYPSCAGCPMGCAKSRIGEIGGNVLIHSLVACKYAEPIYSDVGIIFSCLNVLGFTQTHEDIEAVPNMIQQILKDMSL